MQWVILILIGYILYKQNPGLLSSLASNANGITNTGLNSVPSGFAAPSKPPITKERAWELATATETNLNPRDFSASGYINGAYSGILDYTLYIEPTQCTGQASHLPLSQILPVTALSTGAKLDPEPISKGILSIASLIVGAIFSHHAAAVQRDNAAFCTYVPASNNALSVLIGGVQQGQLTPAQGIAGLQQLPDAFLQGVGPAKNNSPYCNALCEQLVQLRAICFYWRSQFGDQSIS